MHGQRAMVVFDADEVSKAGHRSPFDIPGLLSPGYFHSARSSLEEDNPPSQVCPFAVQFSRRCVDARDLRAGCATVRKSEGDEVSAFKPANANPGAMNDMWVVIALLKNTDAYRSGMHMAPNAVPVVVDRPTLVGDEVDRCITVQTQLSHPYSSSERVASDAESSSIQNR
jgi:hypothetical protein